MLQDSYLRMHMGMMSLTIKELVASSVLIFRSQTTVWNSCPASKDYAIVIQRGLSRTDGRLLFLDQNYSADHCIKLKYLQSFVCERRNTSDRTVCERVYGLQRRNERHGLEEADEFQCFRNRYHYCWQRSYNPASPIGRMLDAMRSVCVIVLRAQER